MFFNHDKEIMYIANPKTGTSSTIGTILKHQFQMCQLSRPSYEHEYGFRGPYNDKLGVFEYYYSWEDCNTKQQMTPSKWDRYLKIVVVREPLAKLHSGFKDLVRRGWTTHKTLHDYVLSSDLSNSEHNQNHFRCYWHTHMTQSQHIGPMLKMKNTVLLDFAKYPECMHELLQSKGITITKTEHRNKSQDTGLDLELHGESLEWFNTTFAKDVKLYDEIQT